MRERCDRLVSLHWRSRDYSRSRTWDAEFEKEMVRLRECEKVTFTEMADALNLSVSRVCKLYKDAANQRWDAEYPEMFVP
jgi:hypothetical protein